MAGSGHRPAVVVDAHLDSVSGSPGADDNASGVAAVLETARLLSEAPVPPRVVLAVFDSNLTVRPHRLRRRTR
ncbi:M28 family peptidase [Streptomyces albiflavescens]|uniref:M28 family peptidase n=1 Tax=Streptomyces albiflavescens TaxID=1623582 RepID=UPI0027E4E0BC|nr:M28 family peptidase [Streptomyces albiflavescens]